jgi:Tfp pilus assembly protein PilF
MLLFDDDLDARNRTECRYLIGLAQLGLGKTSLARRAFRDVLAADPNHVGAAARLRGPA